MPLLFQLFSIQMEPCRGELDITTIDRISAILNPQQICVCNPLVNAKDSVSMINDYIR